MRRGIRALFPVEVRGPTFDWCDKVRSVGCFTVSSLCCVDLRNFRAPRASSRSAAIQLNRCIGPTAHVPRFSL